MTPAGPAPDGTPGQADEQAREMYETARGLWATNLIGAPSIPWEKLTEGERGGWAVVRQAAIAAREPHAAPPAGIRNSLAGLIGMWDGMRKVLAPSGSEWEDWRAALGRLVEELASQLDVIEEGARESHAADGLVAATQGRQPSREVNLITDDEREPDCLAAHCPPSASVDCEWPKCSPAEQPAPELAAAMRETRELRTALRTLADLWDATSDKDEETAARPNRARLVLEERATTRRGCAADIRKLAGPGPS